MEVATWLQRCLTWASAALAIGAILADDAPHCPLATDFSLDEALSPGTDLSRHFTVTSSSRARVQVTVEAEGDSTSSSTVELWVVNDTPSEHRPDEMRQLVVVPDVTSSTSVGASDAFELGLRAVGESATRVRVTVSAAVNDCSESPFVRIDTE